MKIRPVVADDLELYADLIAQMERHYGADSDLAVVTERLAKRHQEYSDLVFLIAEEHEELLGHATMSPLFPAGGTNPAYFVKDIFVTEAARGRGLGQALLRACAVEARNRGAPRLDLTVDANNPDAARLYERLGAVDTKKRYLRWDGASLDSLAGDTQND
ncbi:MULTISPECIES: GNAT family N-acetyltransferase [unclassified Roseibium]|uniref:GNAT family N-acetyltransferase n=1 Tax=unclassified Roseibium TaxID=2629323 RepID=UPI00273E3730|nr:MULTISPECIES: GNAT family N-acetyltransferase [unclassified Roseibium]